MRKLSIFVLAGLLLAAFAAPAFAWEFSMKGAWEFRTRYIARTGPGDLFGNANIGQANGTAFVGLAGPVMGSVQYAGHSARGSDAKYAEQRLDLYPEIRLNKAIRWRGVYSLQGSYNGIYNAASPNGGFGRPSFGDPQHWAGWAFVDSRGIAGETAFASGVWRDSWITAQVPWGIIALGRRPSQFGTGWSTLGQSDIHSRALAIVAPYGPLTIIMAHYLHDSGEDADPFGVRSPFQSTVDQNEVRDWNSVYAFTYRAGNLDMGTLSRIAGYNDASLRLLVGDVTPADPIFGAANTVRSDPSLSFASLFLGTQAVNGAGAPIGVATVGDVTLLLQVTYAKYNNGRFFLNGEFDFQYVDAFRKGARPLSGMPYAWQIEGGIYAGPMKLSLAHFLKTGHDRRGGTWNQGNNVDVATGSLLGGGIQVYDKWESFITFAGADQPINPYQFLIGYYGGGNNAYDTTGYWTGDDLNAFAARLDYAVAANLNIFATYMRAFRQSETGTPRGFYDGGTGINTANANGSNVAAGQLYDNVPNADTDLGWEVDAGLSWKLLEGMTFNGLFAYWQPGQFFNEAYIDTTNAGTGLVRQINGGRGIDPLIAIQGSLLVEF